MTNITDSIIENLKGIVPYSFFLILPLLIIISPINPVEAAQQFSVYRMHQFDLQGLKLGSRSVAFNFEVSSLSGHSRGTLTRKCLMLHLYEVTIEVLRQAAQYHVGGLLVLLPQKWSNASRDHMLALEQELLNQRQDEHHMAIYFAFEDDVTEELYKEAAFAATAGKSASAASMMFKTLLSTGHQLYIPAVGSVNTGTPLPNFEMINIQGKLPGLGVEETLPTIVVVAHYDATGTAPGLAFGYDSNASGVILLLQLTRYFSLLYSQQNTQPKYNIVFLLSAGGKLNYLGTKRWLDEHLEVSGSSSSSSNTGSGRQSDSSQHSTTSEESDQDWGDSGSGSGGSPVPPPRSGAATSRHMSGPGLLNNVALVVCLEGVGWGDASLGGSTPSPLHMHVSKPPRAGSPGDRFFHHLQWAAQHWSHNTSSTSDSVPMVHKKINLKEDFLAWEHERFSLNRLPGMTLSRYASHQVPTRRSILDEAQLVGGGSRDSFVDSLHESTHVVAEALLQLMFEAAPVGGRAASAGNDTVETSAADAERTPFLEADAFTREALSSQLALLTRQSRAQVLLPREHPLLTAMEKVMAGHLGVQNVRVNRVQADARDPEFLLYDHCHTMSMTAHKVKPIVFEMLMSVCISAYLGAFYLLSMFFPQMCDLVVAVLKISKSESSVLERKGRLVN